MALRVMSFLADLHLRGRLFPRQGRFCFAAILPEQPPTVGRGAAVGG